MDFLKSILGDDLYSQVESKINAYNSDEANKDKGYCCKVCSNWTYCIIKPTELRWVNFLKEGVNVIIDIAELKKEIGRDDISDNSLCRKMKAIEKAIRAYTNNNFQNRLVRYEAPSGNNSLLLVSPYLAVGDTLQITQSINKGLYQITNG